MTEAVGTSLEWRAPTRADLPAWLAHVHRVEEFDGDELTSLDDLASVFESGTIAAERDVRLVLAGDTLLADPVVAYLGPGYDSIRVHLWGGVTPAHRGQGIGRRVLEWQLARAAERYAEVESDLPGYAETGCIAGAAAERLFARYGFEPVRYWSHMVHPLRDLGGVAAQADGLRVVTYQEDLFEQVRRAHNEAFADHWGQRIWDKAAWKERAVGNPTFRPDSSFVVLDGTRRDPTVAAYLLAYEGEPKTPDAAPNGYIGQVGTRRPWRGRGLASTLVCASLASMKKAGYAAASLTVDAANPTGAQGLYERLGFVTERRYVSFQRPI